MTDNEKLLEEIKKYQECIFVHQLTCGNDSNHEPLNGVVIQDRVVLVCPECDYQQTYIPPIIGMAEDMEIMMKGILNVPLD